jgi:multidrug efflux pump subunit AcrA (membrane-fusion protein)
LDPKTRTVKVRLEFTNPKWELKPEMYVNITLKSTITKKAITVPEEAVIHSGERNLVVVRTSSGGFESRDVQLGARTNEYYQILSGIKDGEEIVTSSNFLIDSESRLREAVNKLEDKKQPGEK